MEIGKKYELRPECIQAFIDTDEYENNGNMVDIIKDNGGWFEVNNIVYSDGYAFVNEITCANGKSFNSEDDYLDDYFELEEIEFRYFREYGKQDDEVDEPPTTVGVTQIHCIVTEHNVDQIIELLQKTFKK